jgi:hypothetical protein
VKFFKRFFLRVFEWVCEKIHSTITERPDPGAGGVASFEPDKPQNFDPMCVRRKPRSDLDDYPMRSSGKGQDMERL